MKISAVIELLPTVLMVLPGQSKRWNDHPALEIELVVVVPSVVVKKVVSARLLLRIFLISLLLD